MKKNFKRFLSLALVIVMAFAMLPAAAAADDVLVLQAENAVLTNGARPSSTNPGIIGWIGDADNGTVTFTFEYDSDVAAQLNIYYAAGDMNPNRTLAYTVNGGEMVVVSGGSTGGWGVAGTTPIVGEITLKKGTNTIVFSGEGGGAQALNMDRIEIINLGPKAQLTGANAEIAPGGQVRVPLTLSGVLESITTVDNIGGIQLLVSCGEGLELVGFETVDYDAEIGDFSSFDWGTASYDDGTARILGFSPLEDDGAALVDEMVLGDLVFKASSDFTGAAVEIEVEAVCDNDGVECTSKIETVPFEITASAEVPPVVNPFVDVEEDDYFFEPVMWAVEEGITAGTSATTFGPEEGCTRAQVVTFLYRAAGEPEVAGENPFKDVKDDDYFYSAVLWAVSEGITKGTEVDEFSPDETCTRAQIVTFLHRFAGEPEVEGENPFVDVEADEYYYNPVLWAAQNGITAGDGAANTFNPDGDCERCQIVTFLYRYMG